MPLTAEQSSAIDPKSSVWVSANAGTGKTKVLVSRVLRLMAEGVDPSRILCLTFTNAAAAEMITRVKRELSEWAIIPEEELQLRLISLLNTQHLTPSTLSRARRLFLQLVDNPEYLRIQTIHSFCQSLLRRFPLEAGVPPHFTLMDEKTAQELLQDAWKHILAGNTEGVRTLAAEFGDGTLTELVEAIIADRRTLERLLEIQGAEALAAQANSLLGVQESASESLFINDYINNYISDIKYISNVLDNKWKDTEKLRGWLTLSTEEKIAKHAAHQLVFLTQKEEPRKNLLGADNYHEFPQLLEVVDRIQAALLKVAERRRALYAARMTGAMLQLAEALFTEYKFAKARRAQFDYDDLILRAHGLLACKDMLPWVMFRLDGGIDHVLVDEAQDTSAEQWEIIAALCGEFFAGEGAGKAERTLFAVGDFKQSIFSFQGADPTLFHAMRHYFAGKAREARKPFAGIPLLRSFRSVSPVLEAVDAVFNQPGVAEAVGAKGECVQHLPCPEKINRPGLVEIWPLLEAEEKEKPGIWELPIAYKTTQEPSRMLAEKIADTVQGWVISGRRTPGDILVLVQRRGPLVDHLNDAFARRAIPVAGVDRMKLIEHIAVQDLLALGHFLLLPEDDLNLAALLKSPLVGISEEELLSLAYGRKGSLWERAKDAHPYLSSLLARVDYNSPLELYTYVLEVTGGRKAFIRRMSAQVNDVLDEFLNLAAQYSQGHTPSLQGFLHWIASGKTEIKRDLEHGKNEVRVMTVHAAKGLQAPVVFLPDCASALQPRPPRLLWMENGVLFNPRKEQSPETCRRLLAAHKEEQRKESLRLLYVAMTRAEDELYICGCKPAKNSSEPSWYDIIKSGIKDKAEEGNGTLKICHSERSEESLVQKKDPSLTLRMTIPPHLLAPAPQEKQGFATPSGHLPVTSMKADASARVRGNFLHLLLQYLPDVAPEKRPAAMQALAEKYLSCMGEEREALMQEAEGILGNPEFEPLFSASSKAEVPVAGRIGDKVISGQIDRLAVLEKDVLIIDYKTSRTPPAALSDVPEAYVRQLADYRILVRKIYPNHSVRCVLLWTAAPHWMELPETVLEA